jgi:hypothetical protein
MKKAFDISIVVFLVATTILILSIAANTGIADGSKYTNPALQQTVSFIKTIETADFYLTILSAISSLVTYIGKFFI